MSSGGRIPNAGVPSPAMTPDRLREITSSLDRRMLSRLLGYSSENSLRQCELGKQNLPPDKARWLERYAVMRTRQARQEAAWLVANPPPGGRDELRRDEP